MFIIIIIIMSFLLRITLQWSRLVCS